MGPNTSSDIRLEASPSLIEEFLEAGAWETTLSDAEDFKRRAQAYGKSYEYVCLLNNNYAEVQTAEHDFLLALGQGEYVSQNTSGKAFDLLGEFANRHQGKWLFGCLSYDLKNDLEVLHSSNLDRLNFPAFHFFVPDLLIAVFGKRCFVISRDTAEHIFNEINATPYIKQRQPLPDTRNFYYPDFETYLRNIRNLKEEISQGNIYEINYCREVTAALHLNPEASFQALMDYSPAPFSSFYKEDGHYLICASPERFLKKTGSHLISQPMKGTSPRRKDHDLDERSKKSLKESVKERAENVMIVDLVRNDLSRVAKTGTVRVDELFGVYTYPHVHQMISTVSCELREGLNWLDAVKACFPMGSMTGAPKLRAMELIEEYETFKRGLFSGSVGFVTPSGNCDFNVVIRSILYSARTYQMAIRTGSAITALSNPEAEWEECELKARALINCLRIHPSAS